MPPGPLDSAHTENHSLLHNLSHFLPSTRVLPLQFLLGRGRRPGLNPGTALESSNVSMKRQAGSFHAALVMLTEMSHFVGVPGAQDRTKGTRCMECNREGFCP